MKPRLIHQEAMDYSFQAKMILAEGNYDTAQYLFSKAAELESQVAEFYFDKPELEPTRSIVIRSAAFLNLKAGQIEAAQKFIFFGLLNSKDPLIKSQLNDALELSMSFRGLSSEAASSEYNYLNILRLRSINYVMEPSLPAYGHSVSLQMISEFTENYLKSLRAYAISKYKIIVNGAVQLLEAIEKEVDKIINPLVTNSAYGSFKFSIANDFLSRDGEEKEILELKTTIISNYHNEIFINPLSDDDIKNIKKKYHDDDVNEIFRPLSKIKSSNSSYKLAYYDPETYFKVYAPKIVNKQKKQLITVKPISQEDIGELEDSIVHKRTSQTGKISKTTIFKKQLRSYEADVKVNQIEPKGQASIILSEDILVNMNFDSNKGFTFSFADFNVEYTDTEYQSAYSGFQVAFYNKLIRLINSPDLINQDLRDWENIRKLIGNPDVLKK